MKPLPSLFTGCWIAWVQSMGFIGAQRTMPATTDRRGAEVCRRWRRRDRAVAVRGWWSTSTRHPRSCRHVGRKRMDWHAGAVESAKTRG